MLPEIKLLLLLFTANALPILGYNLLKRRWARPVDLGWRLRDGRALLGESKTWRGLVLALAGTPAVAVLVGLPPRVGLLVAGGAMAGDLVSSFLKRRLGLPAGAMALGLDQIPESLLPLLLVREKYGLAAWDLAWMVAAFFVFELAVSPLLFRLNLRKRPY